MNDLEKYLDIDYSELPPGFIPKLRQYIENGIFPGNFLQALICNDLFETILLAPGWGCDSSSLNTLIRFLQDKAPAACCGSPEAMELWKARRGIRG